MSSYTADNPPPVGHWIATHTLAHEIITRQNTEDGFFDPERLQEMQRFIVDPSQKDALLREWDMVDEPGQRPGSKASGKGSLVGLVVARHDTADPAMEDREIEMLREWFEAGAGGAV